MSETYNYSYRGRIDGLSVILYRSPTQSSVSVRLFLINIEKKLRDSL